jgi:HK97 gp10 family phage protein
MQVDLNISGLDEFNKKIAELKDVKKVRSRARSAARKAMKIVQLSAQMGAAYIDDPKTREDIQKNIVIRNGKTRDFGTVIMRVGIMGGAAVNGKTDRAKLAALPGGETVYWRYIEFGTSKMPATPFMRPALQQNLQKITDEFANTFMKSTEKAIAKGTIS